MKTNCENTFYECFIFRVTGLSVKASQTEIYYRTSQLRLRNVQGSQVSSFDFSTLYRESKMYLCIGRLCHIGLGFSQVFSYLLFYIFIQTTYILQTKLTF